MSRPVSVCFVLSLALSALAAVGDDSRIVLQGVVMDRASSGPIQGASVSAAGDLALQDAVTDSEGYFRLELKPSVHDGQFVRLAIHKEGYVSYDKQKPVSASHPEPYNFLLSSRIPVPSIRRQQPRQTDPSLSMNYLRLFGAQQAPIILANMYLGSDPDYNDPLSGFTLKNVSWQPPIVHFWETWEFKNAKPLRGRVWRELFENVNPSPIMGMGLLKVACTGDPVAMEYTRFDRKKYDSCGAAALDEDVCPNSQYSVQQVRDALKRRSLEIGFLAVILENTSGVTLRSLRFHFLEVVKTAPLTLPVEDAQKVEESLKTERDKQLTLPSLRAGQSVIWLLAIYRKDDKGFPASYLSSVTRPVRVEFSVSGKQESVAVRKPLLDKAATVAVPYGWYQQ